MIYQAYRDSTKSADFEAASYDGLVSVVVDYCLHKRERTPFFDMIDALGEDDAVRHLNIRDFNNRIHYEIECGWY